MLPAKAQREDLSALPDQDLVARVVAGRAEAFRAIIQRYNRRLYRVARGVVRDDAEAEDVLQEAYVRAFAALPRFRAESTLSTWLTRIVMNEAIGRLRLKRREGELETAAENGDLRVIMFPGVTASPDPEAAAARAQVRRLLEQAVDDLPEPFRLVFVMRDIEDLSTEETATSLAIRPETVKTRLHRARRLLREALDEKLSLALKDTFPFDGARCTRIADRVMARVAPPRREPA
jgi:RNA polymerase sigma-70 factor (ECF subfamily)